MTAVSQRTYVTIGLWLAGLMLLGVVLSELGGGWLPLPRWGVVTLVLGLSTVKAVLYIAIRNCLCHGINATGSIPIP